MLDFRKGLRCFVTFYDDDVLMSLVIYDSYFRWVQTECRSLGETDNPEVSELLKTAVRCLRERPVLFKYCAEEVTQLFIAWRILTPLFYFY